MKCITPPKCIFCPVTLKPLGYLHWKQLGCNIVVTDKGDTKDYFENDAWFCDPDDLESIRSAVEAAYNAPYNPDFRKRILENYTWERAAEETLAAYKQVLTV